MSNVVIKIVRERPPAAPGCVGYEEIDMWQWGNYAVRHNAWRFHCEVGESRFNANVESIVLIASPDGRVGVWYGRTTKPSVVANRPRHGRKDDTASDLDGAIAALLCRSAAALWDKRRTRGGDRDVSALAKAACRILHAEAFGDPPLFRDTLLAPFARLTDRRPPTPHLLRASEDELLAASALLDIHNYEGACSLLARKGVAA